MLIIKVAARFLFILKIIYHGIIIYNNLKFSFAPQKHIKIENSYLIFHNITVFTVFYEFVPYEEKQKTKLPSPNFWKVVYTLGKSSDQLINSYSVFRTGKQHIFFRKSKNLSAFTKDHVHQ